MSRQVTIQPNFEIRGLFKIRGRNKSYDDFQLYRAGRYSLFFGLKKMMEINPSLNNIYIPSYVCPEVLLPINKIGLDKRFYHIDQNMGRK